MFASSHWMTNRVATAVRPLPLKPPRVEFDSNRRPRSEGPTRASLRGNLARCLLVRPPSGRFSRTGWKPDPTMASPVRFRDSMGQLVWRFLSLPVAILLLLSTFPPAQADTPCVLVVSRVVSTNQPPTHGAVYAERRGVRLLSASAISEDNGVTWQAYTPQPDFSAGLPYGYRREAVTSVCDAKTKRLITVLNSLDTPGLDPNAIEPPVAQQTYYLRYRVSDDGGRTWRFDEPILQAGGFVLPHPMEGVWVGTNAIYLGDTGCVPIVTRAGKVLVPAQMTVVGPDGRLFNPTGGHTYTDVLVLIGSWTRQGKLEWQLSQRVSGDPKRSTRGMIEPTLAEFRDGRILMVMRGSNGGKADPRHQLPSHKWFSISQDGGKSWSNPEPWRYDDGTAFFSPSSMSALFKHSSGRVFWVGNLCATNCQGNLPRWPLVMGEVDFRSRRLLRDSVVTLDTHQPEDAARGRLDLSHVTLREDRQTREIVLTYPRAHHAYKEYEWMTMRLALKHTKGRSP